MRKDQFILVVCAMMLSLAFSCEEKNHSNREGTGSLSGMWQLYEQGYSPGAGYVTESVPTNPSQHIIFEDDSKVTVTIQGLTEYHYYLILNDPDTQDKILALFKTNPGDNPVDIKSLEHSYAIELSGDTLKLRYRFCIEGCHLGLVKKKIE